ncbi:murein hydrolase activator EnvC [Halopseudomonas sp.]|uniref:murein hydrolase activator EnvC family protein n=1 Tax=Halopseudomonas sp. TaxID=2901191 RepID=UPI0035656C55
MGMFRTSRTASLPWYAGAALAGLLCAAPLAAQESPADSREARAELDQTKAEIARLKDMLKNFKHEMSGLESELKQSESEIGRLRRESEEIEEKIREGGTRVRNLREQAAALQVALTEQQDQIARQARAAYMAGQQDYLKLMLNQDDPARMARMMRYYQYLTSARMDEVTRYTDTLEQIRQASAEIVEQQALLEQGREQLAVNTRELQAQQTERTALLASLQGRSRSQGEKLASAQAERAGLEKLIKSIDEAITSIPTPAGSLPFAKAKGKLPLPVKGPIQARYGSQRGGDSRLKWDGLLIGASQGSPVHAIHGGRVVFADWLRGSGLLVILDHGSGYLSLYGHNQSVLKEVGTWVQPGEAVSTVGASGGLNSPALYFAIRHQGRALDPAAWCMLSG